MACMTLTLTLSGVQVGYVQSMAYVVAALLYLSGIDHALDPHHHPTAGPWAAIAFWAAFHHLSAQC